MSTVIDDEVERPTSRRRSLVLVALAGVAVIAVILGISALGTDDDVAKLDPDASPRVSQPQAEGLTLPTDSFDRFDGTTGTFGDYEGRPLVVNFWATFCVPCLEEMPAFQDVHDSFDGKVAFLGMNVNDTLESGKRYAEQRGVTYDLARDPRGSFARAFEATVLPTTVFVRADGTVADVHTGELDAAELTSRVDELLDGAS